ncbi:sugar ABC transporter permease [Paenibacillus filicis]|uniref:Sugar ABC transporter permease n=1 Tax=Paenibacillus gyeongsangnamensis TaxID=3388067 RepID=A0ABT4QA09_9BACL|nr:sugar ABC transporter permease [Paenibacillus filicis]MCZ8513714.1 sugar ABC transporter permease [Paenibacillus filicis]
MSLTIISPLFKSIYMSFTDYSLMSATYKWNNLDNYITILKSPDFYHSLRITLLYVVNAVLIDLLIGLSLALILNRSIKFRGFFRSIVMIPWAIPTIVTALIFMWIYQPDYGVLNYALNHLGIVHEKINWLHSINWALFAIVVVAVFRQTPLVSVMLLAGLQNIPGSLYEAAKIDGASGWRMFTNVTLPLLKPVITSVSLIMVVNNFQMFTLFFTLTGGGPANATSSLAILTYETAFSKYELGKGSAIGVIWLVLLFSFSIIYTRIMNRNTD